MEEYEEYGLTDPEKARLKTFKEKVAGLEREGYIKTDLTADPDKAHFVGTLYAFISVLPFIVFYFLLTNEFLDWDKIGVVKTIGLIVLYIVLNILHELIHGLTWQFFAKNGFRSITFGMIRRTLNPYCSCTELLSRSHFLIGLMMPWFILGIIPCIAALIFRSGYLLLFGVLMALSTGGDLLTAQMILTQKNSDKLLYLDHPISVGAVGLAKIQD